MPQLRRWLPPALLFLLGPAAYHRIITPGWALVDYDVYLYFEPYRQYLAQAWVHGRVLPLWNAGIFLGAPFLANIQAAALYPPNLLFLVLPPEQALGWIMALHAGLAGAGMFFYARTALRLRTLGSTTAGIVYMLNAYLVMHAGHVNQSNTLAWTPWLMLAGDHAALRPTPRRLAAVAVLVAVIVLAGHTQQAYFSFLLAALAALIRLWRLRRLRPALARAAWLAGAVLLGAGLAAIQLAATLDLTRQSVRSGGLPLTEAAVSSLPVHGFLANLLPDYAGEHQAEFAASVGTVALALGLVALMVRPRRAWPWALLGAVALLAALGPRAYLYTALFHVVPGLNLFRVPARLLLFTVFAASVLAGLGVETLVQLRAAAARGRRPLVPVVAALALAAVPFLALWTVAGRSGLGQGRLVLFPAAIDLGNVGRPLLLLAISAALCAAVLRWRRAAVGLPVLVAADLVLLAAPTYAMNPLPDSVYQARPAGLDLVVVSLDQRYLALVPFEAQLPESGRVPPGLSAADRQRYAGYLHQLDPLVPDHGMYSGPLDADGYDGGLLPIKSYVEFRRPLLPPGSGNPPDFADHLLTDRAYSCEWLREAAVTTVLTDGPDPNPPGQSCLQRAGGERGLVAWSLERPLARAHLADGTPARVVSDSGERVVVALPSGAGGRLVLADTWYPGWTASAGGRSLAVRRTAGYLREVEVPPGATEVTFDYRPWWLWPSIAVAAAAAIVTLTLLAWPLLPHGAAAPPPSARGRRRR